MGRATRPSTVSRQFANFSASWRWYRSLSGGGPLTGITFEIWLRWNSRAKEWRLVDAVVRTQEFAAYIKQRAVTLAQQSDRPADATGIALTPLDRAHDADGIHYEFVDVTMNRQARTATITVRAPEALEPQSIDHALSRGARWWPLQMARELDDAILTLRTNELELGLWIFKTIGNPEEALKLDGFLKASASDWFVRETIGFLRRTLSRLDVSSRSIFAIIEPGSCFAGTLMELALAADRSYMLDAEGARIGLSALNYGTYPMANGLSRLATRFCGEEPELTRGELFDAKKALELGLVTAAPDDIDWEEEIRLAIEERASLSPDALTAMEASLRFAGPETMLTRVFGRLTAWQNWVFNRPNAVGEQGALKVYGSGAKPKFNWERV